MAGDRLTAGRAGAGALRRTRSPAAEAPAWTSGEPQCAMASLILYRHAKSEPHAADEGGDRRRRLTARGRRDAEAMGRFLAAVGPMPEDAVISPALRARESFDLALDSGSWACTVREAESLYSGGIDGLLEEIRCEPPTTGTMIAVGHEPTFSEAAGVILGGAHLVFATAGMACIELGSWEDAGRRPGTLRWLVGPAVVKGAS